MLVALVALRRAGLVMWQGCCVVVWDRLRLVGDRLRCHD